MSTIHRQTPFALDYNDDLQPPETGPTAGKRKADQNAAQQQINHPNEIDIGERVSGTFDHKNARQDEDSTLPPMNSYRFVPREDGLYLATFDGHYDQVYGVAMTVVDRGSRERVAEVSLEGTADRTLQFHGERGRTYDLQVQPRRSRWSGGAIGVGTQRGDYSLTVSGPIYLPTGQDRQLRR